MVEVSAIVVTCVDGKPAEDDAFGIVGSGVKVCTIVPS